MKQQSVNWDEAKVITKSRITRYNWQSITGFILDDSGDKLHQDSISTLWMTMHQNAKLVSTQIQLILSRCDGWIYFTHNLQQYKTSLTDTLPKDIGSSYYCLRCKRIHRGTYRNYVEHLQFQKPEDRSLGTCRVCKDHPAITTRENIVNRTPKGYSPITLCEHCNKTMTDLEVVLHLLPMNKWTMARTKIYGTSKVPPSVVESGKIYGTICIQDIKKNTLNWKGYIGNQFKNGGKQ